MRKLFLLLLVVLPAALAVYALTGAPEGEAPREPLVGEARAAAPRPPVDSTARMTDGGAIRLPAVRQRLLAREDSLWSEALRIHYNAIVIDGHIDTPSLMLDEGYDFGARHRSAEAHVDLPRMIEGGLDAAFFSLYISPQHPEGPAATARARRLIEAVRAALGDSLVLATTADEVRAAARSGKKAALMGLEGGHGLAASPAVLAELYAAGVRYVTLTHIYPNAWADASQAPPRWNGLNALGERMVREMNRLGMMVDLAHVSDATFYDALRVSRAPVIVSHSSARALTDGVRNVDDAMLRRLAQNGGVLMINYFDPMVNPRLTPEVMKEVYARLPGGDYHNLWDVVYQVRRERGIPGASLSDVVDHIDHAVQVAGIDHVGLGSDFDGVFDLPAGLQDATRLPWITYELLKRGYTEPQLYKILGGNVLRVMDEAAEIARNTSASGRKAAPKAEGAQAAAP